MTAIEPLPRKIVLPGAVLHWALEVTLRRLFAPGHAEALDARISAPGDWPAVLKSLRDLSRVDRVVRGAMNRWPPQRWNWIERYAHPDECLHVYLAMLFAMDALDHLATYSAWTRWTPTVAAAVAGAIHPSRAARGDAFEWRDGCLRESTSLLEWMDRGGHPDLGRALATFDQEGAVFVARMRDSRMRDATAPR